MSFEEAKQYLRGKDEEGASLYEHLSRLLLKIIVEKPHNANAVFEQLSQDLREITQHAPSLLTELDTEPFDAEKISQLEWCRIACHLFTPTENEAAEISYPDLMTEANVFEWTGVNFGRTEVYQLYLAIKQKAKVEASSLRFWGKIFGRSSDYYVVQGVNPEPPPAEEVNIIEGMEGANKYAFWVCSKIGGNGPSSPNVLPDAIIVGRNITRFFTGDLNAPVPSYPPFPGGTEAHLLRSQIAQITAECSISPSGFYIEDDGVDEGIKAIKKVEEISEHRTIDELKELSSWVHHELLIDRNGRCNQPPMNEDEDSRPEQELQNQPILGSIAEDEVVDGPAWTISACPGTGDSPDSTVCVKSLKWPGAYAVAFGNKFTNIYCGFGCPSLRGVSYKIPATPGIQPEWALVDEEISALFEEEDRTTRPSPNENTEEEE